MVLLFARSRSRIPRCAISKCLLFTPNLSTECVQKFGRVSSKPFSLRVEYVNNETQRTEGGIEGETTFVVRNRTNDTETYVGCIDDLIKNSVDRVKFITRNGFTTDVKKYQNLGSVDESFEDDHSVERIRVKTQLTKIYNIMNSSVEKAESQFDILCFKTPHDLLKYFIRPDFINRFIKIYLSNNSAANLIKAKIWYDRFELFELKRNYGTYYYFLNYYYNNGMYAGINEIAMEMRKNKIPWYSLFKIFFDKREGYADFQEKDNCTNKYTEKSDFDTMLHNEMNLIEESERNLLLTEYETEGSYLNEKNDNDNEKDEIVNEALHLEDSKSRKNMKFNAIDRLESILKSITQSKNESPWVKQLYLEAISHLAAYDRLFKNIKPVGVCVYPRDVRDAINNWSIELKEEIEKLIVQKGDKNNPLADCATNVIIAISQYITISDIARISISSLISYIYKCVERVGYCDTTDTHLGYNQTAKYIGYSLRDAVRFSKMSSLNNGITYKFKMAASNMNNKGYLKNNELRYKMGELDDLINSTGDLCFNWSDTLILKVGTVLLDVIVEKLKYDPDMGKDIKKDNIEDFKANFLLRHILILKNKLKNFMKIQGQLVVDKNFVVTVLRKPYVSPINLPMIIKPLPWTTLRNGGYISNNKLIMLNPSYHSISALKNSYRNKNIDTILSVIDILSGVPWRVNIDVLKVAEHFFKVEPNIFLETDDDNNSKFLDYKVDVDENDDTSENGDTLQEYRSIMGLAKDKHRMTRDKYISELEKIKKKQRDSSKRLECEYKIRLARSLHDTKFYHSFNIDFRGRAYPLSAYLSHVSNDLSRGLLLFAESKALGKRGLYWLKVQIASHAGCGKMSFEDRLMFTENNMDNIIESAVDPINGKRWWIQFDDKWQLLACCIELHKAIQSGDPESYATGIHVHKDGTCNGIQHYAALSRCDLLAKMVNLTYNDKPNDVYSHILNSVITKIEEGVKKGDVMASIASNFVERKIIKQTVMTIPYGVTLYGAVLQVNRHIDRNNLEQMVSKKFPNCNYVETRSNCVKVSRYIAKVTFEAIDKSYGAAIEVQNWLMTCASVITKSVELKNLPSRELEKTELLRSLGYIPMHKDPSSRVQLELISYDKKTNPDEISPNVNTSNSTPDDYLRVNKSFLRSPFKLLASSTDNNQKKDFANNSSIFISKKTPSKKSNLKIETDTPSDNLANSDKKMQKDILSNKSSNNAIKWTSPLGLSIVQPYKMENSKHIRKFAISSRFQSCNYKPGLFYRDAPVSRSQITSFPPNFVHSLDAVHMMLTALICHEFNISYASVHDSYWTHPSDVDLLDRAIAHAFVKLHSLDILGNLRSELLNNFREHYSLQTFVIINKEHIEILKKFCENKRPFFKRTKNDDASVTIKAYAPIKIEHPPEKGKLNINDILNSKYFFN